MSNHRLKVSTMRAHVANSPNATSRASDLADLDKAHEAHIKARTAYALEPSDETMINLIGTWARVTRNLWKLEDKYGAP